MVDPFSPDNQIIPRPSQPNSSTEIKDDNLIDYSADEGKEDEENEPEVPFSNLQRWDLRCMDSSFVFTFVVFTFFAVLLIIFMFVPVI